MKIFDSKNYINSKLKEFFSQEPLLPSERAIITSFIKAQNDYGKLTNKKWVVVAKIYMKYRTKYDYNKPASEDTSV